MAMGLTLPRLVSGAGCLSMLGDELRTLGVARPLLIADRGIERAGLVAATLAAAPAIGACFVDVPENPTAAGVDAALRAYRDAACDGIIALGGGSVIDTAKVVAALAGSGLSNAADLLGQPALLTAVVPLIAIPTTVGTGSDSSPVAAVHVHADEQAIGFRSPLLVPRVALCDPDLVRTLPPRLIAATAVDALSHCIEGFFADPPHPVIDALALDGITRVVADAAAAMRPDGDAARASLMAAAFAGGLAIHKGLGPAHAIALVCGDQDIHHGTVIAVALPATTALLDARIPDKGARIRAALGVGPTADIAVALRGFAAALGLPISLDAAGYRWGDDDALAAAMARTHFCRTSPYMPTEADYAALLAGMHG